MGSKQKAGVKNFDEGLRRLCVASFFFQKYTSVCLCRTAGETLVSRWQKLRGKEVSLS